MLICLLYKPPGIYTPKICNLINIPNISPMYIDHASSLPEYRSTWIYFRKKYTQVKMIFNSSICFIQHPYNNCPPNNLHLQGICIPQPCNHILSVAGIFRPWCFRFNVLREICARQQYFQPSSECERRPKFWSSFPFTFTNFNVFPGMFFTKTFIIFGF